MEERRHNPHCNLFELHCKGAFEALDKKLDGIHKVLVGNGETKHSILYQTTLNTNHRIWMETWGRAFISAFCVVALGFVGALIWIVSAHAR